MRNLQPSLFDHAIAKQQDIDINRTRPLFFHAHPPHFLLDGQCSLEQRLRRVAGLQRDHAVQEPGLVAEFHRLGFIKAGNCAYGPNFAQPLDRRPHIGGTVPQVGSQGKVDKFTHSRVTGQSKQLIL